MIEWKYRIERLKCALARRGGFDVDLTNAAVSVDELYPGIRIERPSCIVLPGQCERVTGAAFGSDVSQEIASLNEVNCDIGPTLRYEFKNVVINKGIIYGSRRQKLFNLELPQPDASWTEYKEVTLRSSRIGCYFFGEWLLHDSATHFLAEQVGRPWSMPTPPWPHKAGYLALFGQEYSEIGRAFVERLFLFDDLSQNSHKTARLRELRSRVAEKNIGTPNSGRIVFLMRGTSGQRRYLINEQEIAETLERRGAAVLHPEVLSVAELVCQLFGARLIIGVEGSQLYHGIYTLRDGSGILAIQPPDRFYNSSRDWARVLNMRYGIVVGQQCIEGFYLPIDDLLRTIDLMER